MSELYATMEEEKYRAPSADEAPWLIIGHESHRRIEKQTFCTMSPLLSTSTKSYTKTIVELNGKSILTTTLGWLVLQDRANTSNYSLWNPITYESIHLPPLVDDELDDEQPTDCVLTDNDVSVLLVFFLGQVFSCRPFERDCKWGKQRIEHNGPSVRITKAITCKGYIYAYASFNVDFGSRQMFTRMKVIDNDSNSLVFEHSFLDLPENSLKFRVYPLRGSYLVAVSGVVYAVHMMMRHRDDMSNYDIHKAFVWRLDLSQSKWILVESLGDRALLLGDSGCTWCWARTSKTNAPGFHIEADCIYLAESASQTVHSYRLRDNSYTFLLPHPNFRRPFIGPAWFMPHNPQRLSSIEEEKTGNTCEKVENDKEVIDILLKLPEDILISTANHLHLFDYMNLRTTCKTFHKNFPKPK
ncbi:hypothetical protein RND81_08G189900 [Saponaria officinalis]|uniref:DUF295 domain-containing protein n=1 Tax=Saponaria officinalis TaxID=3572 RepID=A0AAW1J9C3_SAPOF